MLTTGQLAQRRLGVGCRHHQLIDPETTIATAADGDIQYIGNGGVELLRSGQVPDDQLNMVDQPSTVQFLRLHIGTSGVLCGLDDTGPRVAFSPTACQMPTIPHKPSFLPLVTEVTGY